MHLDHTIVHADDPRASARFLSGLLGLPAPVFAGPFAIVRIDADTSLDFMHVDGPITPQHYAFLVTEREFDSMFERLRETQSSYWADPGRRERGRINHWDGGRGVYFDDPNGHLLELITRSYGTGGVEDSQPHPLFASA